MEGGSVFMREERYFLVSMKRTKGFPPYMRLSEVADRCGIHPELIERFVEIGLVEFVDRDSDGEGLFQEGIIPIIRRILRLRNELGVNYAGIGVVLELMARIDALEARIRELEM
jgi:MerR family transcriptional regulator, heat shock protein HspR